MVLFLACYFPRVQCSVQPPQSSARQLRCPPVRTEAGLRQSQAGIMSSLTNHNPGGDLTQTAPRADISSANESSAWARAANQSAGMRCISRPERRSSELLPTPRPSFIDWSNVVQVDLSLITFIACVSVSVYYFSSFRSGKWWYKSFCHKFLLLLTSSIQTWCLDLRDFE